MDSIGMRRGGPRMSNAQIDALICEVRGNETAPLKDVSLAKRRSWEIRLCSAVEQLRAELAKTVIAVKGADPPASSAGEPSSDAGLRRFMRDATELASQAWPDDKPDATLSKALFAHLLEEAGELAGASRSFWGRSLRPDVKGSLAEVTAELGDVLVIVLRIAATHGADPVDAITGALAKFRERLSRAALKMEGE